jgi:hypothetical protein
MIEFETAAVPLVEELANWLLFPQTIEFVKIGTDPELSK